MHCGLDSVERCSVATNDFRPQVQRIKQARSDIVRGSFLHVVTREVPRLSESHIALVELPAMPAMKRLSKSRSARTMRADERPYFTSMWYAIASASCCKTILRSLGLEVISSHIRHMGRVPPGDESSASMMRTRRHGVARTTRLSCSGGKPCGSPKDIMQSFNSWSFIHAERPPSPTGALVGHLLIWFDTSTRPLLTFSCLDLLADVRVREEPVLFR